MSAHFWQEAWTASGDEDTSEPHWALVIHGGAGTVPSGDEELAQYKSALERVVVAAGAVLASGGGAVDAVETAVQLLEDEPLFNAGCGSVLNAAGEVEMDASIMDGRTRRAGAVSLVRTVKNPVRLARRVMTATPHVYLAGDGAERFADGQADVERATPDYFVTERRRLQLERSKGTVGAVALDRHGHVAAATSTGGMCGKMAGRIGDSPVLGAGTYADSAAVAVSCTGDGEYMLRSCLAHDVWARVTYAGQPLDAACRHAVDASLGGLGGEGGLIAVDPRGRIAAVFNSQAMHRACLSSRLPRPLVAVFP